MTQLPRPGDPVRNMIKQTAERIRFYRRRLGLRQIDVAKRAGMSTDSLSSLEAGVTSLTMRSLVRVAFGLGIEPYRLLMPPGPDEHAPRYGRGFQPRARKGQMRVERKDSLPE